MKYYIEYVLFLNGIFTDNFKRNYMKTRNKVLIGGAIVVIAYLLWDKNKKKKGLTADNVASGSTSTAPTNESSNLDLPTGMDLPNLTPSTNVPTEVAIQESIAVVRTPAIVESKPTDTETALNNSLIAPIYKDKDAEKLLALQTALNAEKRAELDRQLLAQQTSSGNLMDSTLRTAIPTVAPSISPVEKVLEKFAPTQEQTIDYNYQDAERS